MADAIRCPSCGATMDIQARFCGACGRPLTAAAPASAPAPIAAPAPGSTYGQILSPGGPPSIFAAAPTIRPTTLAEGAPKPFGILLLAFFVVATAVVGLAVARDYAYWANWRFSEDEFAWGLVDGVFALGYLITSVYAFTITPKLWSLQPSAWPAANLLAVGWSLLNLGGIVLFGLESLSLVGLVVMGGIWTYLNLTSTRAMFGQKPLGWLAAAAN